MNLEQATTIVTNTIKGKQDPDKVSYLKTWDELGYLKGFDVWCFWGDLQVLIDITDHYVRVVGDLDKIPDYINGTIWTLNSDGSYTKLK